MSKEGITERLRELARSEDRSLSARLEDVLPEVEAALRARVKRSKIVEALCAGGLEITENTFAVTLKRLRARNRRQTPAPAPARTPAPAHEPDAPTAPVLAQGPDELKQVMRQEPRITRPGLLDRLPKKGNK
jgi:hypothetical protein